MNNSKAIMVAAVILGVAIVLSAWFDAQGQIVSAYVTAYADWPDIKSEQGTCPVREPSTLAPLVGVDL